MSFLIKKKKNKTTYYSGLQEIYNLNTYEKNSTCFHTKILFTKYQGGTKHFL